MFTFASNQPLNLLDFSGLFQATPASIRLPGTLPDRSSQSYPWGRAPNKECCDDKKIKKRSNRVKWFLDGMRRGIRPSNMPGVDLHGGGFTESDIEINTIGTHYRNKPRGAEHFGPNMTGYNHEGDPCVFFCALVHEWTHFTDYNWYPLGPPDAEPGEPGWDELMDFVNSSEISREKPGYEKELRCLELFYK